MIRLSPLVHCEAGQSRLRPDLIGVARENGFAGYPGEGANRWPAVHTRDAAALYRLAVERRPPARSCMGSATKACPCRRSPRRSAAAPTCRPRSVPEDEIPAYFGFLAGFITLDGPTSNARTREVVGWEPTHPGLIADLAEGHYFA